MNEDTDLLGRYATDRSESDFTELIRRQVDLVYSAALRLVNGDVHRAQDVTQQVFTELARQAHRLSKHPALAGWLYTTTRLMALRTNRTEQRRKAREQEASTVNELLSEPASEPNWDQLRPGSTKPCTNSVRSTVSRCCFAISKTRVLRRLVRCWV